MGGATAGWSAGMPAFVSLSPRGRGSQGPALIIGGGEGSIPAWAGQPNCEDTAPYPLEVYPRAGGATWGWRVNLIVTGGLSPRWRGNPLIFLETGYL